MTLLDRLHLLFDRIGISPKVGDPLIGSIVLVISNWIISGQFDAGELRLAEAGFLLGLIGLAAPAATGVSQEAVVESAPELRSPAAAQRLSE